MKAGAGKGKGSQFERDIAKALSLWLTNGQRPDTIWRSEISGGRFTCSKGASGNPGDLMATDVLSFEFCSQFVVECKHWKKLEMHQFLQGYGELYKALEKVKREALATNKSWLLISKQNHQPTYLFMATDVPGTVNGINWNHLLKSSTSWGRELKRHLLFQETIMMFEFENFLSDMKSERFIEKQNFDDRPSSS